MAMGLRDRDFWMWSEACEMLARAERLQRQFGTPQRRSAQAPAWEPPVDMLETAGELLIFAALPGVDPDQVQVVIDGAELTIVGQRVLPAELRTAVIHRLELPQGRFERRILLPAGRYNGVQRAAVNGCLVIALRKAV
jgi:HSP20 family molecular chaperone IbpA